MQCAINNCLCLLLQTEDQFTIQWDKVHNHDHVSSGTFTFQLRLFKSGVIHFAYREVMVCYCIHLYIVSVMHTCMHWFLELADSSSGVRDQWRESSSGGRFGWLLFCWWSTWRIYPRWAANLHAQIHLYTLLHYYIHHAIILKSEVNEWSCMHGPHLPLHIYTVAW